MSKGDRTKTDRNSVSVDGKWLPISCDFLASRACAELSPLAAKLLLTLIGQLGAAGYGNGRLDLHPDRMKAAGWASVASRQAAIRELVDANILVCTRQGAKGRIGLYGVTLFPMNCKLDCLEVGPGAWRVSEWRSKPQVEAAPTKQEPAVWRRPRRSEKRKLSTRSGSESGTCVPTAGVHVPQTPPCTPATGAHPAISAGNAIPQRDSPSRTPSATEASRRTNSATRMGRLLAARVRPGMQRGYAEARERLYEGSPE